MIGRTGILSTIIVLTMIVGWTIRPKFRYLIVLLPFFIFGVLFMVSSRFEQRISEIPSQISEYQKGNLDTSQAQRLDFWRRSVQAVNDRPWLGSGVGSWPYAYKKALNGEVGLRADNPHQQFFLWWVEGGAVGLMLLLGFFGSIIFDSLKLECRAKKSLLTVLTVLIFTCLMNCPLQDAGISEFFAVLITSLMCLRKPANSL
jgi:O-antigen ligase